MKDTKQIQEEITNLKNIQDLNKLGALIGVLELLADDLLDRPTRFKIAKFYVKAQLAGIDIYKDFKAVREAVIAGEEALDSYNKIKK